MTDFGSSPGPGDLKLKLDVCALLLGGDFLLFLSPSVCLSLSGEYRQKTVYQNIYRAI